MCVWGVGAGSTLVFLQRKCNKVVFVLYCTISPEVKQLYGNLSKSEKAEEQDSLKI